MFNIGSGELVLIAVVALLVLGPKRLPELARGLGKFLREFRRQTDEVRHVVEREFYKMDKEMDGPPPPPAPRLTAATGTLATTAPTPALTEEEDHQLLVPADPDPAVRPHQDPPPIAAVSPASEPVVPVEPAKKAS